MLFLLSDKARKWANDNINYESYQVISDGIAIYHRCIKDIYEAMISEGFNGNDFKIV